MLEISVTMPGRDDQTYVLRNREISIGRDPTNDIVIDNPGVSNEHAQLRVNEANVTIADLGSTNGTFVNGMRIESPVAITPEDELLVWSHRIRVRPLAPPSQTLPPTPDVPEHHEEATTQRHRSARRTPTPSPVHPALESGERDLPGVDTWPGARIAEGRTPGPPATAKSELERLDAHIQPDIRGLSRTQTEVAEHNHGHRDLAKAALARCYRLLNSRFSNDGQTVDATPEKQVTIAREAKKALRQDARLPTDADLSQLARDLTAELCGLGPLGAILRDTGIRDIEVRGTNEIEVRRTKGREQAGTRFHTVQGVHDAVERLTGRRLNASMPIVKHPVGHDRVLHAVHESVAMDGPFVWLRKVPSSVGPRLLDLVESQVLTRQQAGTLATAIDRRLNLLVCHDVGIAGAPLSSALAARAFDAGHQCTVVRNQRTLQLPVGIRVFDADRQSQRMLDLVRLSQELDSDHLVIHELSGIEALEVAASLMEGRRGLILSMRASSAQIGLRRLSAMLNQLDRVSRQPALIGYLLDTIQIVASVTTDDHGHMKLEQLAKLELDQSGTAHLQELHGHELQPN